AAPPPRATRGAQPLPTRAAPRSGTNKAYAKDSPQRSSRASARSLLENEGNAVPYARNFDGLAVDHARLVLELRGGVDGRTVEEAVRRLDDDDVLRGARAGHGELDDDITLEAASGRACGIDRRDLDDRQVLAVADAETETADLDLRRKLRRRHGHG